MTDLNFTIVYDLSVFLVEIFGCGANNIEVGKFTFASDYYLPTQQVSCDIVICNLMFYVMINNKFQLNKL